MFFFFLLHVFASRMLYAMLGLADVEHYGGGYALCFFLPRKIDLLFQWFFGFSALLFFVFGCNWGWLVRGV